MPMPRLIAVDGPAGSGKSTVSHLLAQRLGYLFIDTGIFYRAITLLALRQQIPLDDAEKLGEMTRVAQIEIRPEWDLERQYRVLLDGEDVTDLLRSEEVEKYVSVVSAVPNVRHELVQIQRQAASKGKIIMVGRDIGTVVLPDADIKFYIDASIEERARRRFQQKVANQESVSLSEIENQLYQRDKEDMKRKVSPLRRADDAIYILTDGMDVEAVVDAMLAHIEKVSAE